ncbi:telomere repeats-binding bouquet formation protein 2 [Aplochiton taeniatus]
MFLQRTAWFSNSVRQGSQLYWVYEGGVIADWKTADYLFSEDATCPDTQRIFDSEHYLGNNVTVFHSFYLAACEKCHSVKSVCIGHYVLPPTSVQNEVKAVVGRFIWEQDYNQSSLKQDPHRTTNKGVEHDLPREAKIIQISPERRVTYTPQRDSALCCEVQHYPVNNMISGYVAMGELKKYSGELRDFRPGHSGSSVCKARCNR